MILTKKIKVAIVGFGKGASIYNAPDISSVEGFEITKILTANNENIAVAKKEFPNAKVVTGFEEITVDPEIDLVVITTPNHLHKEFAEKALNAGKHVVVEKPFTPTVAEADELIQLARKNNRILSVHHNRRWDSDFLTIKKLLKEKKLGVIVEYEVHFDRFRNEVKTGWKEKSEIPGSGILFDLGSHLIDQALVLFGLPTEVFADLRIQRENSEVIDNFELLLFYPGLKVSLKAGMLVKEKSSTFSIFGRNGSFLKYGEDPQEEVLKLGLKSKDLPDWGMEPQEIWGKLNTLEKSSFVKSERGNYTIFYQNIYNAITDKEDLLVKPEEARDVIKVIELALKSQAEKCRVAFS
jgi:predicted dehydrogenase